MLWRQQAWGVGKQYAKSNVPLVNKPRTLIIVMTVNVMNNN
jgi:hypothetical protein